MQRLEKSAQKEIERSTQEILRLKQALTDAKKRSSEQGQGLQQTLTEDSLNLIIQHQ